MTVKEELHQLVEELPEEKTGQARQYLQLLRGTMTPEERASRVQSAYGAFAHLPGSVDAFLKEKQKDIAREEERAERRQRGEG